MLHYKVIEIFTIIYFHCLSRLRGFSSQVEEGHQLDRQSIIFLNS